MTKLYADRQRCQLHEQQRQHQVTFRVDQTAESMSSLSDVSDVLPPDDDVDAGLISRVYGLGRKPTTIALSFRPPRKQRPAHKLPKLAAKTTKRPGNVTSPERDATSFGVSCHSDGSHVTSGRHNGGIATSKSMHTLSKTNPEVNHCATLPAADGNGIKTVTTLSGYHRSVTSSSKAIERRTANGLTSSDWKLTRSSNDNVARATSVIFTLSYYYNTNCRVVNYYL